MTSGIVAVSADTSVRRMPRIIETGCVGLVFAVAGVIYLVAHIPDRPALAPAVGLLIGAAAAVLGNVVALARVADFAWWMFWKVWRWTMLAYAVIAGILIFAFIYDQIPASQLALLVMTLVVFAVDIPLMLAFSVARYQPSIPPQRSA